MADGAKEMTKSLREVFGLGEEGIIRLMCWSHTHRNYTKKLIPIRRINKVLSQQVDNDIQNIQWMIQSEQEFLAVYTLLEAKYLEVEGQYTEQEQEKLTEFFSYFRTQWGPESHVSKWYEGAFPFHCCNNQGLERRNCALKDDFSYREQLNMGQFVNMMQKVVQYYTLRDDSVLDGPRLQILSKNEDGEQERKHLKIQEAGHKYFLDNLKPLPATVQGEPEQLKPGRQIEINNVSECKLLCNNPGMELGEVKRIIGLPRTSNKFLHKSLKELVGDETQQEV